MKYVFIFCSFVAAIIFSCKKNEDLNPTTKNFIHIMDGESSQSTVSARSNSIGTYNVYLSSGTQHFRDSVTVTYKVTAGNGLTEGVDYSLITKGNMLTFLPGIYDMPIRVKWLANPIDTAKDNTLKIELLSNNKDYIIGLPGPSHNQKMLTITKTP